LRQVCVEGIACSLLLEETALWSKVCYHTTADAARL
jgi:hypothetical protein